MTPPPGLIGLTLLRSEKDDAISNRIKYLPSIKNGIT